MVSADGLTDPYSVAVAADSSASSGSGVGRRGRQVSRRYALSSIGSEYYTGDAELSKAIRAAAHDKQQHSQQQHQRRRRREAEPSDGTKSAVDDTASSTPAALGHQNGAAAAAAPTSSAGAARSELNATHEAMLDAVGWAHTPSFPWVRGVAVLRTRRSCLMPLCYLMCCSGRATWCIRTTSKTLRLEAFTGSE